MSEHYWKRLAEALKQHNEKRTLEEKATKEVPVRDDMFRKLFEVKKTC